MPILKNRIRHYILDPDIVSEELVKFKELYELMEENIEVTNLLLEPDKKNEDEEKHEDNLPHFDSENEGQETVDEEAGRKKKN